MIQATVNSKITGLCLTFHNNTAFTANGDARFSMVWLPVGSAIEFKNAIFIGNRYVWLVGPPNQGTSSVQLQDCIFESLDLKTDAKVSLNIAMGRIAPFGGDFNDIKCPFGSASFTQVVADYGMKRHIIDVGFWLFLIEWPF
jgi:hypothetical protein